MLDDLFPVEDHVTMQYSFGKFEQMWEVEKEQPRYVPIE